MALAVLSPWPTTPAALVAARTCLRDALRSPGLSDDRADALGGAAAAIVERYASGAPGVIKSEAVIRCAAWLKQSPASDLTPVEVANVSLAWRPNASRNVLRSSGSMSLLSPWHRPRGTILEESSS